MLGSTRKSGETVREADGDTFSYLSGDGERDRGGLLERNRAISRRTGLVKLPASMEPFRMVHAVCGTFPEDFMVAVGFAEQCW